MPGENVAFINKPATFTPVEMRYFFDFQQTNLECVRMSGSRLQRIGAEFRGQELLCVRVNEDYGIHGRATGPKLPNREQHWFGRSGWICYTDNREKPKLGR